MEFYIVCLVDSLTVVFFLWDSTWEYKQPFLYNVKTSLKKRIMPFTLFLVASHFHSKNFVARNCVLISVKIHVHRYQFNQFYCFNVFCFILEIMICW